METALTLGYGDILPKSDVAKILAMLEIVVSLIYVVLLFSVASSYARELRMTRPAVSDQGSGD
jgi:hypothetical protein